MSNTDLDTVDRASPSRAFWLKLKDAIRGTEADYTKIGLRKAIFLLAVPMILELIMESTFAVVDIYFVGRLGASAVTTVGLTETYLFLLYSIAMGLATAITPTKINLVFFWLIQIPLSYLLAITFGWQHSGVFWGVFVSETSVGLFTLWLFTRGKWKTAMV